MINTDTTEGQEIMLKEETFYANPFQFSYNSLRKLMENPRKFYKEYILDEREKLYGSYLVEGSLIHFLLLENNSVRLEDRYAVMNENMPSDNVMAIIDTIYKNDNSKDNLDDYGPEILEQLNERDFYSNIKDNDKRIGKICDEKGREYFNFLKNKKDKIIVDVETLSNCIRRADIIRQNKDIMKLIGQIVDNRKLAIYNEHEIVIDKLKDYKFGIKGIIDNLVVDTDKKEIYINDFKTTSKSLADFPESVEKHMYWLQAAMYYILVRKQLKPSDDWKIMFSFIVVDKDDNVYQFKVNDSTMVVWLNKMAESLKKAEFHYNNKSYEMPYDFQNNLVML